MRYYCSLFVAALMLSMICSRPAPAVVQFYNVFAKEHLDTHPDKEFATAVKKAAIAIAGAVYHLAMREERLPRFSKEEMPEPSRTQRTTQ